jgi:hypothetical protein
MLSIKAFLLRAALAAVVLGCSGPSTNTTPSVAPAAPSSVPAGVASRPPEQPAPAPAPVPAAPPPEVARSGKAWPFHTWDHAEAVTFNQVPMRENIQLEAYNDDGWTSRLVERKPITEALAKKAVDLVARTEGDVEVSKCPFPRHAVMLYDHEVPVASINICFMCGDIVLWPHWEKRPSWDDMTDAQLKQAMIRSARQMKLYEKVFPSWKTFFRDEVGFPIDAKYR